MGTRSKEQIHTEWSERELRDIQLQLEAIDKIEAMETRFAEMKEKEHYYATH